jgi:hyperosmotically inducible protein
MTSLKSPGVGVLTAASIAALVALLTLTAACAPRLAAATDDASITARVRTVLMNDTEIAARGIEVTTSSGVVTISGTVGSADEADRALELARKVEGVRDVRSSLQVRAPGD